MDAWTHLSIFVLGQVQPAPDSAVEKGLDSAVTFAQSASQWAYITVGASVALLLKDLAKPPESRFVRWSFLIFVPGWLFLGLAIWKGMRVHGAYIIYLMNPKHDVTGAIMDINADAACQLLALKWGLFTFFVWLVLYLIWWIGHPEKPKTI